MYEANETRMGEQINFVRDEAEKKLRQMIQENDSLINEEFEVIVKIKAGDKINKYGKEITDLQRAKLCVVDPRRHFELKANNSNGYLAILEDAKSDDEITSQCKGEITRVISDHIMNVCPEAIPSVVKPFVQNYLVALSVHLDSNLFYYSSNGIKTGHIYCYMRRQKRPSRAGIPKSSRAKKSKKEIEIEIDKSEDDETVENNADEMPIDQEIVGETSSSSSDNKLSKLWKSLFGVKVSGIVKYPDSQQSLNNDDNDVLNLPEDPKIVLQQKLKSDIYAQLETMRRSDLIQTHVITAIAQVVAQSIVDQKKIVSREAIKDYTEEFILATKFGIDERKLSYKNAEIIVKEIKKILDFEINNSSIELDPALVDSNVAIADDTETSNNLIVSTGENAKNTVDDENTISAPTPSAPGFSNFLKTRTNAAV